MTNKDEKLRRDLFSEVFDRFRGIPSQTDSLDSQAHRLVDAILKHMQYHQRPPVTPLGEDAREAIRDLYLSSVGNLQSGEFVDKLMAIITIPQPQWRPISEAKYNVPYIIETESGHVLKAALMPNHSINENEKDCDQWVADTIHPECWTDGCCWENNAEEEASDQPMRFMPLPTPPAAE